MKLDKSLLTDIISIVLIGSAYILPDPYKHWCLLTGLFALSGAFTNQIAIHMLFEKVPLFYGSGVIQLRFEAFKASIKDLMMSQFFTQEQLNDFFSKEEQKIDLAPIIENTDFTPAYDALTKTVMESSFGGMLGMFGGVNALEGLRAPFSEKLKLSMLEITKSDAFNQELDKNLKNSSLSSDILESIERMIDKRLEELTPIMVKEIVQNFIKEHLGWLVVWGGFFGGLIGLISAFIV
ncbi:MAG: DUF445 domain-containing protein [Sulfurospirillaceae bacterium]|nr:DUF445 domain-containing protein [Sulfurospirillaceae bacterium]MDD2827743.1 DUF445 domain-containing protein [Sulfurospirillaceae bacterium]